MATTLTDRTAIEERTISRRRTTPVKASRPKERTAPINPVHRWATAGVGITLTLSGWLNGMAFSEQAKNPVCGWALGIAIPVMVLVFSRVGAILYTHNKRMLAYAAAIATLSILLLSIQHCAVSISALTGEHVALSALMAASVDLGLVICECATVSRK